MGILIVEDNPVNAKILEVHLQKNGYETVVASTAKRALAYLMSSPQVELIICDIIMPEMDGLELLGKIKELPEWKDIPVMMCSSLADLETVRKAVKAGCEHYLIKPIEKHALLRKVQEALKQKRAVLKDRKEVITRLGLDKEAYEEVEGAFSAIVNEKIRQLEKQLAGGTGSEIGVGLSELHENAIYFGAERLKDVLEKLPSRETHIAADEENSDYLLLIKELKLVQNALDKRQSKPDKSTEPKRAKKRSSKKSKKSNRKQEKRR
ncbi:MAG: response regulator [Deltaproteobacteria bacterium]|nr:response regulator [Deltaproteobacteria bacterium]